MHSNLIQGGYILIFLNFQAINILSEDSFMENLHARVGGTLYMMWI